MQQLKIKGNSMFYGFPSKIEMIDLKGKHVIKEGNHCLINCIKKDEKRKLNSTYYIISFINILRFEVVPCM